MAAAKRSKTPDKQAKNRQHMKEIGEATEWKPGQSGNPAGRPTKEACLTTLLKEMVWEQCPPDKQGKTKPWREIQVMALLALAAKGNSTAIKEVWSRLEGNVEIEQTTNVNITYKSEITPDGQVVTTKHVQEPDTVH